MAETYIVRYSLGERVAHWLAALCFTYLLLSGLALRTPIFYGWAALCGGPRTVAWLHPLTGVVYMGAVLWLFGSWAPAMRIPKMGRIWWRPMRGYVFDPVLDRPVSDKFSRGQKVLFWIQISVAFLLFLSGVPLWFTESFPNGLRRIGLLLHEMGFILGAGNMILHVYISLFVTRGALRAMLHGTVTEHWAKAHHPFWFRDPRRP